MKNLFKRLNANTFTASEAVQSHDSKTIHQGIRGDVYVGHDLYQDSNGISRLGELIVKKKNQVVIGGSNYILEKILDVKADLNVEYLNNIMGIGQSGPEIESSTVYPADNKICLFGVGTGGCGSSYLDVKTIKPQDREIPGMVPFRVTDVPLEGLEQEQYWFHKENEEDGKHHYYLKAFASKPKIKNLWKDAPNKNEDGSPVTDDVHESGRTEGIESFAEIILQISKHDLREFFELYEGIEHARFNTLGLFTGVKGTLEDGSDEYKQVKLLSMLTFGNELLHMNKDLTIIYRLYVS